MPQTRKCPKCGGTLTGEGRTTAEPLKCPACGAPVPPARGRVTPLKVVLGAPFGALESAVVAAFVVVAGLAALWAIIRFFPDAVGPAQRGPGLLDWSIALAT